MVKGSPTPAARKPAAKGAARKPATTATARPAGPDLARLMPFVGLAVAVWASLPKYSGPKLNVTSSKEVVDHVIPAMLVLVASVVGILAGRRAKGPGALRFLGGMAVLLAGLWMMATHLPLVTQAMRGDAPWPATIYHTSAALAVFGLGLLWATVTWAEADDKGQAPAQAKK
ncbi:MAG: hypothetical protein M3Y04_04115 [Actinomycetota bacterium]|nr:hypothetical protein [Actinomycetota bacterium]